MSIIAFYLGLKTNTTTLERNLGKPCRQLAAHSGPGDEDGHAIAAVLEVALDGPKREKLFESFHNPSGEHKLTPTHFARACAKMWVHCFGRRFQYKYSFKNQDGPAKPRAALKCSPRSLFANFQRKHQDAMSALNKAGDKVQNGGLTVPCFVEGVALPLQKPAPFSFSVRRHALVNKHFKGFQWSSKFVEQWQAQASQLIVSGAHSPKKTTNFAANKKTRFVSLLPKKCCNNFYFCCFLKICFRHFLQKHRNPDHQDMSKQLQEQERETCHMSRLLRNQVAFFPRPTQIYQCMWCRGRPARSRSCSSYRTPRQAI